MSIEDGIVLLFCVAVGWAWPAVGMRMLEPTLRDHAPAVENHRGVRVPVGLGLVWLVWALGSTTLAVLLDVVGPVLSRSGEAVAQTAASAIGRFGTVSSFVPEFLVVGVFVLGLVDDVYGDAGPKGLRGHLARLREGVLTTPRRRASWPTTTCTGVRALRRHPGLSPTCASSGRGSWPRR
jgi:hypothetical protein